ncbi:m7GpppX diphosphatase, partial [Orchesella cincta]
MDLSMPSKRSSSSVDDDTVFPAKKSSLDGKEERNGSSVSNNKAGVDGDGKQQQIFKDLSGFTLKNVLSNSADVKRLTVEGTFPDGQTAVVVLDKKPFTEENFKELFSSGSRLKQIFQNDIYGNYDCVPGEKSAAIKATIVYPATQKHVEKYMHHDLFLVDETPGLYEKVTLPHLEGSQFNIQWVFNILEHKKEEDRIVFEDPDPSTGFILLPDLKWDGSTLGNLYLCAIVHAKEIKSLRDLNADHLPLLKNIFEQGTAAIKKKYGLTRSQLRIYLHYQPSYYHLHVHFTSLNFNAPGIYTEKSHLLQTVISNIEGKSSYYQDATLPFVVKKNDSFWQTMAMSSEKSSLSSSSDTKSIKVFAEYLHNLRAVNLYVFVPNYVLDDSRVAVVSVYSNKIELILSDECTCKLILEGLLLQDCCKLPPRTLSKGVLCYRLVVKPESGYGSTGAEVVSNFEKTVDEGAKNLVKNSINTVALKEGTLYRIKCRFCSNFLSESVKFDRIRPLPSNNWVENAHELWFCHPPETGHAPVLHQDVSARLDKINLSKGGDEDQSSSSDASKTIVELLKCPDKNYCFYGPCNWAINKDIANGVQKNTSFTDNPIPRADCLHCNNEIGSFTSEFCVKIWDYGVEWVDQAQLLTNTEGIQKEPSNSATSRLAQNFKSIAFATIYELSDHPTFRFTVTSTCKGNSLFLWNIDRNLSVYEQEAVSLNADDFTVLKQCKVAKFFFAVKENNVSLITDPREIVIIQESEQNEQNILALPDYVYKAGVETLRHTSILYSREEQSLQCGYLIYDV